MSNPHADFHGYKAFNKNWMCLNRQYTCPGEFRSNHLPSLCQTGMHFCLQLEEVFWFYGYDLRKIHVAEVEAFGSVAFGENKCSTDGLRIIKELSISDILQNVDQQTVILIAKINGLELIFESPNIDKIIGYRKQHWSTYGEVILFN